jgi:SET domain-containing protein
MVTVKQSKIHGRGLFATKFIRKGTVIGSVEGRRTTKDGPYVLWLDARKGIEVFNELKFINHSDQANAVYYDDLTVVALVGIQAGEEVTHHYDGE